MPKQFFLIMGGGGEGGSGPKAAGQQWSNKRKEKKTILICNVCSQQGTFLEEFFGPRFTGYIWPDVTTVYHLHAGSVITRSPSAVVFMFSMDTTSLMGPQSIYIR